MRKTSILGYGQSDSGKSTQARYIALYVWFKNRKKTRYIALDRGSLWNPCQDLVDGTFTGDSSWPSLNGEKIVIPCEFPTDNTYNPYPLMRKFRRGEWPEGGVINRPTMFWRKDKTQTAWSEYKEEHAPLPETAEVKWRPNTKWLPWTNDTSEEIGAVIVDSLTTFATAYMSDAKQKNVRAGNESGAAPRMEEGEQMGTNTQTHYGDAHTEILDAVQAFQNLPVEITYFTALEGLGQDDDTGVKKPALGPETVGKAINAKLPQRFTHTFHLVATGTGSSKKIQAWYCKHDSEVRGLQWPAKVTLTPVELEAFWKKWKEGFIPLTLKEGLGEFLRFRDEINSSLKVVEKVG